MSTRQYSPYHGPEHKTVRLTSPFSGLSVDIDADIAPLIVACWELGWETYSCCQGRRDIKNWSPSKHARAYVGFSSSAVSRNAASLYHAAGLAEAADRAGVGPRCQWTQWRFTFHPWPPYRHTVFFRPVYIEAITAELERLDLQK